MNIDQLLQEGFTEEDIKNSLALPSEYMSGGFIYVLSNESLNGIYKVGMTRRNILKRLHELSASTSIPTPFKLEALFHSEDPVRDEREIHKLLEESRVSLNREFFSGSLSEIIDICRECTQFSAHDDLSVISVTNEIVSLQLADYEIEVMDVIPSVIGNDLAAKNLLIEIGGKVLYSLLQKHNAKLAIMPNGELELIRSIDDQLEREYGKAK